MCCVSHLKLAPLAKHLQEKAGPPHCVPVSAPWGGDWKAEPDSLFNSSQLKNAPFLRLLSDIRSNICYHQQMLSAAQVQGHEIYLNSTVATFTRI